MAAFGSLFRSRNVKVTAQSSKFTGLPPETISALEEADEYAYRHNAEVISSDEDIARIFGRVLG